MGVPVPVNQETVTISDSFCSKYASIFINCPDSTDQENNFNCQFLVSETPSFLNFIVDPLSNNPLKNYANVNAVSLSDSGDRIAQSFIATEFNDFNKFYITHADSISKNIALQNLLQEKTGRLRSKQLDFIKEYKKLYYAFWYFRREVAPSQYFKTDTLLQIYNNLFPDSLRLSTGGRIIQDILYSRVNTRKGSMAPDFIVKNTNGNIFS